MRRSNPASFSSALTFNNAMLSMTDFLLSGILVRHPTLKLAYSEGQIGRIPYIPERLDTVWEEHRAWTHVQDSIPEYADAATKRKVLRDNTINFLNLQVPTRSLK